MSAALELSVGPVSETLDSKRSHPHPLIQSSGSTTMELHRSGGDRSMVIRWLSLAALCTALLTTLGCAPDEKTIIVYEGAGGAEAAAAMPAESVSGMSPDMAPRGGETEDATMSMGGGGWRPDSSPSSPRVRSSPSSSSSSSSSSSCSCSASLSAVDNKQVKRDTGYCSR